MLFDIQTRPLHRVWRSVGRLLRARPQDKCSATYLPRGRTQWTYLKEPCDGGPSINHFSAYCCPFKGLQRARPLCQVVERSLALRRVSVSNVVTRLPLLLIEICAWSFTIRIARRCSGAEE